MQLRGGARGHGWHAARVRIESNACECAAVECAGVCRSVLDRPVHGHPCSISCRVLLGQRTCRRELFEPLTETASDRDSRYVWSGASR